MPKINFTLQGLDAQWPSRRWLDLLDGPAVGPPTGVWLGNASESASLYIGTYPRTRFDPRMVDEGDDPLNEIALSVTFQQINRILFQLRLRRDGRAGLVRALKRYAEERAHEYRVWRLAEWQATSAQDQTSRHLRAHVTTLAGWESGFATTECSYIAAHAYGMTLDNLRITPVLDSSAYGFNAESVQMRSDIMSSVPGAEASAHLPQDLAHLLGV